MTSDTAKPAMTATFLSDQDLTHVQGILATYGLSGFDASVRLWGRGKAIDVRGTLRQQELSCLLAIARFLGNESANEPGAPDAGESAASPPPPALPASAAAGMTAG